MNRPYDHPVLRALARDEAIHVVARLQGAHVVVTDRRLAVASGSRLMLDVAIDNV